MCVCVCVSLSVVSDSVTPWTVACKASLSMEFFRQEYWSGLPFRSPEEGFPCGSAVRESACNAGDPGSILGSGISPGEGIGYPLQYSSVSLVAR